MKHMKEELKFKTALPKFYTKASCNTDKCRGARNSLCKKTNRFITLSVAFANQKGGYYYERLVGFSS